MIDLMELPCPNCEARFMLQAPDLEPGETGTVETSCPDCDWSDETEMERVAEDYSP